MTLGSFWVCAQDFDLKRMLDVLGGPLIEGSKPVCLRGVWGDVASVARSLP